MGDLMFTDRDGDILTVAGGLGTSEEELLIETNTRLGVALNEQQALQLVCHIIKVFHVPESNIEVIWFEEGHNRADILRKAADRLDATASQEAGDFAHG